MKQSSTASGRRADPSELADETDEPIVSFSDAVKQAVRELQVELV